MITFYITMPLGLLFIVVSVVVGFYEDAAIKRGTIVEGTVIRNVYRSGSKGGSYTPEVSFRTRQGREVRFMPSFSSSPPTYDVGEKLRVVYQGDGQSPRILSFGARFGLAWSFMAAGVALVIVAVGFRFGNDFVNSYYTGAASMLMR
ncbi:MAG: DUF3592 domain-containing protein [Acidobacteriota bacterium]|nr:DUF3592 domain-containing protein [Acidobacteriota bacterium]